MGCARLLEGDVLDRLPELEAGSFDAISLAAYLAKLILPPPRPDGSPRRLLVPFSGAGSEIIGALRAGWEEVVGIDNDPASVEDARQRVRGDAPLLNAVETSPAP